VPPTVSSYTFSIKATNSSGGSGPFSGIQSYTVSIVAGVPGAPTIGTATAGNAQASVTFSAPTSNGGATITSYTAAASPGGMTATGSTSPLGVMGLANGKAYRFTVTATNSRYEPGLGDFKYGDTAGQPDDYVC
jgi:hypothetical protein